MTDQTGRNLQEFGFGGRDWLMDRPIREEAARRFIERIDFFSCIHHWRSPLDGSAMADRQFPAKISTAPPLGIRLKQVDPLDPCPSCACHDKSFGRQMPFAAAPHTALVKISVSTDVMIFCQVGGEALAAADVYVSAVSAGVRMVTHFIF